MEEFEGFDKVKLFEDAINGMRFDIDFWSMYLPEKYCNITDHGETIKINFRNLISDISKNCLLDYNTMEVLYYVFQAGDEVRALYEGFEPLCEEQRLYNLYEKLYLRNASLQKVNTPIDYYSDMIPKLLSNEISETINFGVLHTLGCNDENTKKMLTECNFLPEKCFIPKEKMEELTEDNKTKKFLEVIKFFNSQLPTTKVVGLWSKGQNPVTD